MKPFALQALGFFCGLTIAVAAADPVKEYLSTFSPLGGDNRFYSDDRLLRLDLDLNNDGQQEVLLSMARDRDGKQGNLWRAFAKDQNDYHSVGGLTFDPDRFYLGNIDEIGRYGLVAFGPAGGGEGIVRAYLLERSGIRDLQIATVSRDPQTRELDGLAIRNKYFREKATSGNDVVAVIDATALSEKYGVKVEATTYRQALEDLVAQNNRAEHAATPRMPSAPTPAASPSYSTTSHTSSSATASPNSPAAVTLGYRIWPWLLGILAAAVLAFLVWKTQA